MLILHELDQLLQKPHSYLQRFVQRQRHTPLLIPVLEHQPLDSSSHILAITGLQVKRPIQALGWDVGRRNDADIRVDQVEYDCT